MFKQEWTGFIRDGERYRQYNQFKSLLDPEKYLTIIDYYPKRVMFTKARASMLPINANIHRFSHNSSDRDCKFCKGMLETEIHILYHCCLYESLRTKFLGQLIAKPIYQLLDGSNRYVTLKVAAFFLHAMNIRKRCM